MMLYFFFGALQVIVYDHPFLVIDCGRLVNLHADIMWLGEVIHDFDGFGAC